jgi:nucleoside-diphosphate-sugar epimerase
MPLIGMRLPPIALRRIGRVLGMKVVVIGATGTIGAEVAKALSANKYEVVRASRDVKVDLEDRACILALFEKVRNVDAVVSCVGDALFKPLAELTDADFEFGLRNKLMGQVSLYPHSEGSCR